MLQKWIQHIITQDGADLYRYKGVIAVKGIDKKYVFQGVGMLLLKQILVNLLKVKLLNNGMKVMLTELSYKMGTKQIFGHLLISVLMYVEL